MSGRSKAKTGGTANFAISLSSYGADAGGVTVTLTTSPRAAIPHFAVCPSGHTSTCKLSRLANGQVFQFQAAVLVPKASKDAEHVKLTAEMTATKPKATVLASATVTATVPATRILKKKPRSTRSTRRPVSTSAGPRAGSLPLTAGSLPLLQAGSLPLLPSGSLPLIPGLPVKSSTVKSSTRGNIGSLLPTIAAVTPSPAARPAAGAATPGAVAPHSGGAGPAAPAANGSPLSNRLIGTQLIALAALCAGIGIVIARFTRRTSVAGDASPAKDASTDNDRGAATDSGTATGSDAAP